MKSSCGKMKPLAGWHVRWHSRGAVGFTKSVELSKLSPLLLLLEQNGLDKDVYCVGDCVLWERGDGMKLRIDKAFSEVI